MSNPFVRDHRLPARERPEFSVDDALSHLLDVLDDPIVAPNVRLAVLACAAELSGYRRTLLATALYEIGDALDHATR